MRKIFSLIVVGAFTSMLAGCLWQSPASDGEFVEPEVTIEQTMDAAELTPAEAETQMVSDDDNLEIIESELDATIILEEDLSNL